MAYKSTQTFKNAVRDNMVVTKLNRIARSAIQGIELVEKLLDIEVSQSMC